MPTESTFLFAGLLFLAAALGYVFARYGDADDDEDDTRESARANFVRGFRHLLDEEPDQAVEIFTNSGDINEEGLDTQIAIGGLFRRRGEVDRAIRMHQNLLDRPGISRSQRDKARFALAEDYFSAGLFDRAEDLYLQLREAGEYRVAALRRLLRICEVTAEWDRAVDLCGELLRIEPGSVAPAQLAHYYCELAENARKKSEWHEAYRLLEQAEAVEPGKLRCALIRGDLAADQGRAEAAAAAYVEIARTVPAMLGDVLPRVLRTVPESGLEALLNEVTETPEGLRGIALAVIRDPQIVHPAAIDCLGRFIEQQPILRDLAGAGVPLSATPDARREAIGRVRKALHQLSRPGTSYQCADCGYYSSSLQWQCPGCRAWDTVRAADRLLFKGSPV
ncbi:MAG: tetratricopeptide repeat protein [Chromatiales bacterium]|nr:tetratricopeptide repeat protein [Chromatiales bacterium]